MQRRGWWRPPGCRPPSTPRSPRSPQVSASHTRKSRWAESDCVPLFRRTAKPNAAAKASAALATPCTPCALLPKCMPGTPLRSCSSSRVQVDTCVVTGRRPVVCAAERDGRCGAGVCGGGNAAGSGRAGGVGGAAGRTAGRRVVTRRGVVGCCSTVSPLPSASTQRRRHWRAALLGESDIQQPKLPFEVVALNGVVQASGQQATGLGRSCSLSACLRPCNTGHMQATQTLLVRRTQQKMTGIRCSVVLGCCDAVGTFMPYCTAFQRSVLTASIGACRAHALRTSKQLHRLTSSFNGND